MPIKKISAKTKRVKKVVKNLEESKSECCQTSCCSGSNFGKLLMLVLFGILLVYLIFYIGTLINNNLKKSDYIGMAPKQERTVAVTGFGKITSSNDIAMTTLGYTNTSTDVAKAQADNKKVMDKVMAELKRLGVSEKDIKSSYSVYPQYNYSASSGRKFNGYQVTNQLTIKIRDLDKIQSVLALAGKYGANQISGLSFTVDDNESLKSKARAKALVDANKKAQVIAKYLGVRLGKAISYVEYENSKGYPLLKSMSSLDESSIGGSGPTVSGGSSNVEMNVNVVYEIR
jgi:uncharacterized protein